MITIDRRYIDFYNNGNLHRTNGPSYIRKDCEEWIRNGKYHRINGPAIIDYEHKEWWINDIRYTETEYNNKIKEINQ